MTNKAHGPQGIRVWQGYRSEIYKDKREKFVNALGELFIPITVQMMEPIGLRSYFPAILPESNFTLPDEIALMSYSSQEDYYKATRTTTPGKAYSVLHGNFFNFSYSAGIPKSKSDFPIAYENKIELGQPYYLCDKEIDWRDNKTTVYCAKKLPHVSTENMLAHIEKTIPVWLKKNININGSILICEDEYVLYWEHSTFWDSTKSLSSLFPSFSEVLQRPTLSDKPLLRSIPPLNTRDYNGVEVSSGSNLDIRLIDNTIHKKLPPVRIKLGDHSI